MLSLVKNVVYCTSTHLYSARICSFTNDSYITLKIIRKTVFMFNPMKMLF